MFLFIEHVLGCGAVEAWGWGRSWRVGGGKRGSGAGGKGSCWQVSMLPEQDSKVLTAFADQKHASVKF